MMSASTEKGKLVQEISDAEIGARIKHLRGNMPKRHIMTVLEMLHGVKWHPMTVDRVESGERPLKLTEAIALAGIFGVTLDELVASGTPKPSGQSSAIRELTAVLDHVAARIQKLEGA